MLPATGKGASGELPARLLGEIVKMEWVTLRSRKTTTPLELSGSDSVRRAREAWGSSAALHTFSIVVPREIERD